jgi:hypothetical protein
MRRGWRTSMDKTRRVSIKHTLCTILDLCICLLFLSAASQEAQLAPRPLPSPHVFSPIADNIVRASGRTPYKIREMARAVVLAQSFSATC